MAETKSGIVYEPARISRWRDEERFEVFGVKHRGKKADYAIFGEMTLDMPQDNLSKLYEIEKPKGNPVPASMDLIWEIGERGYDLRDENPETAEGLRNFLRGGMRRYPNTLTRIHYSPKKDAIVHNVGTSDKYVIQTKVVGSNEFVDRIDDKKVLDGLLGTKNVSNINEVSQWIHKTDSYIRRLNSKPMQLDKRIARFDAFVDRLGFCCIGGLHGEYPAFRVMQIG